MHQHQIGSMVECGDTTDNKVDAYTIYELICDNWFPIVTSDIACFYDFHNIHAADLFSSWLEGKKSTSGMKTNETNWTDLDGTTLQQQIKNAAIILSKHLYSYVCENIPKKSLVTLFNPFNRNLNEHSLYLSLLHRRLVVPF